MEPEIVKFPFTSMRAPEYSSYPKMIQTRFIPNFQLKSISTAIIAINITIFILMHIIYKSGGYQSFLQWPHEMDKFLLDVELVKAKKIYIYQVVTAMFMHKNYLHLAGNMVFAFFVMYEMEYSWKPSILLGLVAGICANCLAVLTLEGRFLGYSAVLTSFVGMIITLVFMHCSYLQGRMGNSFYFLVIMMVILVVLVIGFGSSLLIHLYGLLFGCILSAGFYPRMMESDVTPFISKIFKIIAIVIVGTVIGLTIFVA